MIRLGEHLLSHPNGQPLQNALRTRVVGCTVARVVERVLPKPAVELCARKAEPLCGFGLIPVGFAQDLFNRPPFDVRQVRRPPRRGGARSG
jgi:hypothetical protein